MTEETQEVPIESLTKEQLIAYIMQQQRDSEETDWQRYEKKTIKMPYLSDEFALKGHVMHTVIPKLQNDKKNLLMKELQLSDITPELAWIYSCGFLTVAMDFDDLGYFGISEDIAIKLIGRLNTRRSIGGMGIKINALNNASGTLSMSIGDEKRMQFDKKQEQRIEKEVKEKYMS